jgi:hypothetical protein
MSIAVGMMALTVLAAAQPGATPVLRSSYADGETVTITGTVVNSRMSDPMSRIRCE